MIDYLSFQCLIGSIRYRIPLCWLRNWFKATTAAKFSVRNRCGGGQTLMRQSRFWTVVTGCGSCVKVVVSNLIMYNINLVILSARRTNARSLRAPPTFSFDRLDASLGYLHFFFLSVGGSLGMVDSRDLSVP